MRLRPRTLLHQRVASNLGAALDAALRRARPGLIPIQRPGLDLGLGADVVEGLGPADRFDPSPDVAVIDADYPPDARHARAAHLVAEVEHGDADDARLPDGTPWQAAKLALYRAHPACEAVVALDLDRRQARVHTRFPDGWREAAVAADGVLDLPGFGLRLPLARLLDPGHPDLRPAPSPRP